MNTKQEEQLQDIINDEVEISFGKAMISKVVDYIKTNLDPDDIFNDDKLREYVRKSSLPEDVFREKELELWAEDNGYQKSVT